MEIKSGQKQVQQINRRELLKLGSGALLGLGLWPGALRADDKDSAEFWFIEVNDTHFHEDLCGFWMEKAFKTMLAGEKKPAFILHCGDLSDNGLPEQLGKMKEILGGLGVPVYAVPGNHDYKTNDDSKAYDDNFSGRRNYNFDANGWQFVALDTTDGTRFQDTTISKSTFDWMDKELPKLDKKKPLVLFTHFPLGDKMKMRPTNGADVLDRFKEYNLQAVFCGHYHAYQEAKYASALVTTDRCCSRVRNNHDKSKEKGWFLCRAKDGKIERNFVEFKA